MRNLRLDLCYDGTRYRGWQRLSNTDNTIQGKLEAALSRILGEDIEISGNHGGGDNGLMHNLFLERNGVAVGGMTYLDVSIDSHKMAFGAEKSRKMGKTVVL